MKIVSDDFVSNCLIEAVKAKLKDFKNVRITVCMPWQNEVFCPHFMWSDGKHDYDFGNEGMGDQRLKNWTLHRGHVRQRGLGFNQKYKNTMRKWRKRGANYE